MSDIQHQAQSDAAIKFPDINNNGRGDSAHNGLVRNKSQGPTGMPTKTPFAAQKER